MSKLYNEFAKVYHEMYQCIFDYEKDFKLYDRLLKEYGCKDILEIGCGSGNLAQRFLQGKYNYTGLDMSNNMLAIARENNPGVEFIQGDMRDIDINQKYDAILITGRSFTHMTTNEDVMICLKSVYSALNSQGILIFDNFNADKIFLNFKEEMTHVVEYNGKRYKRESKNSFNLQTGWTWNWNATYYISEDGKDDIIVEDSSILRAFTEDEIELFLQLNQFLKLNTVHEESSFTIVAKRKD